MFLVACPEDEPKESESSSGEANVDPSECSSFTSAEECPNPCSWGTFRTFSTDGQCTPGTVGACVYTSSDVAQGCGMFDGCNDAWGYITIDETQGFASYCGGTSPGGWRQCSPEEIEGGNPGCVCACAL